MTASAETLTSAASRRDLLLLALVLALAAALRLPEITGEAFWADEYVTANAAGQPTFEVFPWVAEHSVHPPLYYFGVHLWTLAAGHSETAIRLYGLGWSLVLIALVWLWTRQLAGPDWAHAAALLVAVLPRDVFMAAEARMYGQAAALALLSTLLFFRWSRAETRRSQRAWLALYTVSAVALCGTHYVAASVLVAQGAFVLLWFRRDRGRLARFSVAGSAVSLAFLAWIAYVIQSKEGTLVGSNVDWIPFRPLDFLTFPILQYGFPQGGFGMLGVTGDHRAIHQIPIAGFAAGLGAVGTALFLPIWLWLRHHPLRLDTSRPAWRLNLGLFLIPLAVMFLCSWLVQPVFFAPRSAMFVLPFFVALLVGCLRAIPFRKVAAGLYAGLIALCLAGTGHLLSTLQKDPVGDVAPTLFEHVPVDVAICGNPGAEFFYADALAKNSRYSLGRASMSCSSEPASRCCASRCSLPATPARTMRSGTVSRKWEPCSPAQPSGSAFP